MPIDVPTRHRASRRIQALPAVALVGVAVIWGVTFSVVDFSVIDGVSGLMPPADLVAWRFALGTVVLVVIRSVVIRSVFLRGRRTPRMPATLRLRAVALGGFLGAGFLLQTWALTYTDAIMSAFLTGLLVVIAPLAGWLLFRDRLAPVTWIAVAVATAGLGVLSLQGAGFGPGELLTLLAAASWGVHLVLLARWAKPQWAIEFAGVQTATVAGMAMVCIAVGAAVDGRSLLPTGPVGSSGWLTVIFLAVLSTAGAMVLLSWAQSRMSAARAAVILTLEPAIAGVTATFLGSQLGVRTLLGGALLLLAMYLVELGGPAGSAGRKSLGHGRQPRSRRLR